MTEAVREFKPDTWEQPNRAALVEELYARCRVFEANRFATVMPEDLDCFKRVLRTLGVGDDTTRLDWLEANWGTAIVPVEGNIMPQGTWCVEPLTAKTEDDVYMHATVRGAIDAAMAGES